MKTKHAVSITALALSLSALLGACGDSSTDGSTATPSSSVSSTGRIDASGKTTSLVEGGLLDFPASLAFAGTGAERALYVTSCGPGMDEMSVPPSTERGSAKLTSVRFLPRTRIISSAQGRGASIRA